MTTETEGSTGGGRQGAGAAPGSDDPGQVAETLRRMVTEEMFLLGQELNDSLDAGQQDRLDQLTASLDEVCDLMASHRRTRRRGPDPDSR